MGAKNCVQLGVKIGGDFGAVLGANFWGLFGGIKKISAESFKKESAVCLDEKRSLLKKKAQLFLHDF